MGKASPCHFYDAKRDHGDDFVIVGRKDGREHAIQTLQKAYDILRNPHLRVTYDFGDSGWEQRCRARHWPPTTFIPPFKSQRQKRELEILLDLSPVAQIEIDTVENGIQKELTR